MRIIPVNVHNILDYLYGVLIIAAPWLLNFTRDGAETYIPVAAGVLVIIISLLTNYKYSLSKTIAFNTHLTFDIIIGFFVVVSPWLFGFSEYVYAPHVAFGVLAIIVSLLSKKYVNYREY